MKAPEGSDVKVFDGYSKFLSAFKSIYKNIANESDYKSAITIYFGANLIENSAISDEIIYMHPIEIDGKLKKFVKYEAGSEEGVALLLLDAFCSNLNLGEVNGFIEDLDIGYLSAESSISEEELEEIVALVDGKRVAIVVADDIYTHSGVENIAAILATIAKNTQLEVVMLKPKSPTDSKEEIVEVNLSEPDYLPSYDGAVVYNILGDDSKPLVGSKQFALAAKIDDAQLLHFNIDGIEFAKEFKLDSSLKGTIAINPTANLEVLSTYRFKRIKINKVGSKNE